MRLLGATLRQAFCFTLTMLSPVAAGGGNEIDNLVDGLPAVQPGQIGNAAVCCAEIALKTRLPRRKELEDQVQGLSGCLAAMRDRVEEQAWQVAYVFMTCSRLAARRLAVIGS